MKLKIPNILTIGRIILVPFFIGSFYLPGALGDWIPFFVFVLASPSSGLILHHLAIFTSVKITSPNSASASA